jgi:hypothetical protein
MKRVSTLLALAILVSACSGGFPSPTSPTPTPLATPATTYTLSGVVSEQTSSGQAPVGGARVTEMSSQQTSVTDLNGRYTLSGLAAASHSISVAIQGYVVDTMTVTMTGDTQLDFRLDRASTYVLSGVVFEITAAGRVPIEGVEVYCDSCGSPVGHTFVYTDAKGFYSLSWTVNGTHPLLVTKAGFGLTGGLRDEFGRISAIVKGDTRFDIQLLRH